MNLKRLIVHTLFLCPLSAFATTAVTGHITRLDTTTPGATAYVRFWLRGTRGNQPRITGTGAIAPQFSGSAFYVDLPADASGNISGTIYSTRDSTGTGAGDIEAGGSYTAVYYGMQVFNSGIAGPEIPVHAKSGGTLDIANVTPVSTLPVITSPSGDTTYARIDGGNTPFSGPVSFGGNLTATAGQNSAKFYSLNSALIVDGVKYAQTPAGIQSAITDATASCRSVFIPAATIAMGSTQITIPPCVKVSGAGMKQTILQWTSNLASGAIGMTSPVGSYLGNLELNFNTGNTSSAIRITGSDAASALDNTFENILIDFSALGGVGSAGIFASSSGPSFTDVVLNTFRNIIVQTADQAVLCQGCEGNYWQVIAQNVGAQAGSVLFNEQAPNNNEIGDIRMESGTGNFINEICLQVAGSNNQFRLTCDGNLAGITAVNDLGSYNSFQVGAIGSPTLGTIASTSQDCFIASSLAQSTCSFHGATIGANPLVQEVNAATVNLTAQGANIGSTTLYAVPSTGAGLYRVSCYTVVTRAATTSSTLPSCIIGFTDNDNSTVQSATILNTNAANTLTTIQGVATTISVKASTNITYSTSGYATSGATSMQYAIHIRLEAL